jgi:nucleoside-diphosphate-sugar epimerase
MSDIGTVAVTGANGFVGRALCDILTARGLRVRALMREQRGTLPAGAEAAVVGTFDVNTEWRRWLEGVDCVVHLAARVHVMNESVANEPLYEQTNVGITQSLAEASIRAGVRRFVFLSSVKVNGERTTGKAFRADDVPAPEDAYGRSKWLAEEVLDRLAKGSAFETVVVRPPLVYGAGVRGNFLRLLEWTRRELPLPLAAIRNRRSFVSVWNLCDLIDTCLRHPDAAGGTFMVSDDHDLSTPDLLTQLGAAMRRRVRLIGVPLPVLRVAAVLAGRRPELDRLSESLIVDASPTRARLAWHPPLSLAEGFQRTVTWYEQGGGSWR